MLEPRRDARSRVAAPLVHLEVAQSRGFELLAVCSIMSAVSPTRMFQIHPTRRCALRCPHCLASSMRADGAKPDVDGRDDLDVDLMLGAVEDASDQGYNLLAVVGAHPLDVEDLDIVLQHARSLGMRVSLTTAADHVRPEQIEEFRDLVDLWLLSIDGPPLVHDRLNGRVGSFERVREITDHLRRSGCVFGAAFALAQQSSEDIAWLAQFSADQGARLFQVQGINAAESATDPVSEEIERAYAYLGLLSLAETYASRMAFHVDIIRRDALTPAAIRHLRPRLLHRADAAFSTRLSPLVLEGDGHVVPWRFGFDRSYAVANLHEERLSEGMRRWATDRQFAFDRLCQQAFDALERDPSAAFFNWHERVAAAGRPPRVEAERASAGLGAGPRATRAQGLPERPVDEIDWCSSPAANDLRVD